MIKLSYILRHQPHLVDSTGWADISFICRELQITREKLEHIVKTNNKKRFEIKGDKIRALQGHSFNVDLQLDAVEPPEMLFHVSSLDNFDSIMQKGLLKQSRHAVHMTASVNMVSDRSQKYKNPLVLIINALEMHKEGYKFYCTKNNVWLTDTVPPKYLKKI